MRAVFAGAFSFPWDIITCVIFGLINGYISLSFFIYLKHKGWSVYNHVTLGTQVSIEVVPKYDTWEIPEALLCQSDMEYCDSWVVNLKAMMTTWSCFADKIQ